MQNIDNEIEENELEEIVENRFKTGLVLEGGGIRAIFESGVLDAFIENDIEFPYVIGVSAGSCNGVSYLGKNIHRMRDIYINYSNDKRYKSVESVFKNGEYLNSKWIFGELTYEISPLDYDTYEKSNATMCAVVTNAATGKAEYFYPKDFRNGCEELKASCAMPLAARPVKLGKDIYFDGGVTDSIPLEHAFEDGCEKCVVILTQDRTYWKHPFSHEKMLKRALKKYPRTINAVIKRHEIYNAQRKYIFEQEKLGNALVICPKMPLNASSLGITTERQKELYELGYKEGLKSIERVKSFINS